MVGPRDTVSSAWLLRGGYGGGPGARRADGAQAVESCGARAAEGERAREGRSGSRSPGQRNPHRALAVLPAKQRAGRTPTTAAFKATREDFDSGKAACLWLVERFRGHRPTVLAEYQALTQRSGAASAGSRFARTTSELFPEGSPRAGNTAYYAELSGGWFVDTNINHKDKFTALVKLSHICGLEYPAEWEFRPSGGTKEHADHQAVVVSVRGLLAELLSGKSGRVGDGASSSAAD